MFRSFFEKAIPFYEKISYQDNKLRFERMHSDEIYTNKEILSDSPLTPNQIICWTKVHDPHSYQPIPQDYQYALCQLHLNTHESMSFPDNVNYYIYISKTQKSSPIKLVTKYELSDPKIFTDDEFEEVLLVGWTLTPLFSGRQLASLKMFKRDNSHISNVIGYAFIIFSIIFYAYQAFFK